MLISCRKIAETANTLDPMNLAIAVCDDFTTGNGATCDYAIGCLRLMWNDLYTRRLRSPSSARASGLLGDGRILMTRHVAASRSDAPAIYA